MATEPTTGKPAVAPKSYTAVVYVHGMGQQRRFEEMSRLIDSLDKHANAVSRKAPATLHPGAFDPRWLASIMPRLEPCRVPGAAARDDVGSRRARQGIRRAVAVDQLSDRHRERAGRRGSRAV